MKKFKIIIINVLVILSIFIIFDLFIYYKIIYRLSPMSQNWNSLSYISRITTKLNKEATSKQIFEKTPYQKYRRVENPTSSKKAITIFGCSFAYGDGLNDNQTFSYKLGQYTKAPIYNRGLGGWGIQHALFQVRSEKFYDIVPESQYVIYLYLYDHIRRSYTTLIPVLEFKPLFIYKEKDNKLVFDNATNFIFHFPLLSRILEIKFYRYIPVEEKINFMKLHFLEMKKAIDEHWKDTKFVIFVYDGLEQIAPILPELQEKNFIIVDFEQLVGESSTQEKYFLNPNDTHPNELVWDSVVPKLVQYLEKYENKEIKPNDYTKNNSYEPMNYDLIGSFSLYDSIGYYDDILLENHQINKIQAINSYLVWVIGHFFKNSFFNNLAYKMNPKNQFYFSNRDFKYEDNK